MGMTARALTALLLFGAAPAYAQQTKAAQTTEINTNWPDNTTGLITPALLRSTVIDSVNSYQQGTKTRDISGSSDTITVADYGNVLTYNNAVSVAVAIAQAAGSFATFNVYVKNVNTGPVTITPAVSTINGAAALVLQQNQSAWIVSDGANYRVASSGPAIPIGPLVINTPASTLTQGWNILQSAAGTTSTTCVSTVPDPFQFPCLNLAAISADVVNASAPFTALDGWQFNYRFGGSTVQGARQAFDVIASLTAATSGANANRNYVAGIFQMDAITGDGGTNTGAGSKGNVFGINPVVRAVAAATNLTSVQGGEVDVSLAGTAGTRFGWSIVSFPGNIGAGTFPSGAPADAAINIGAVSGGGATNWGHGIVLSQFNGLAPIGTGGCVLCTDGNAATIQRGIDLSSYTISGNFLRSVNFQVDGTGNLKAAIVQSGATTVASLPACAAGTQGARYFVTDQNTAVAYHGAVTGGGASKQGVTCDGTAWYQD